MSLFGLQLHDAFLPLTLKSRVTPACASFRDWEQGTSTCGHLYSIVQCKLERVAGAVLRSKFDSVSSSNGRS